MCVYQFIVFIPLLAANMHSPVTITTKPVTTSANLAFEVSLSNIASLVQLLLNFSKISLPYAYVNTIILNRERWRDRDRAGHTRSDDRDTREKEREEAKQKELESKEKDAIKIR